MGGGGRCFRHHGRAAPGATARGAPHPEAPPTPRLARNFFIKAPSPYGAYFFLALNTLVLLLIRVWGGKSQDASRQETRNCDAGHIGEDQTGDRVRLWFDRWRRSCHAASASSSWWRLRLGWRSSGPAQSVSPLRSPRTSRPKRPPIASWRRF